MTTKVAFLGLGAMGSRMAGNLLSAGHDLTVWNRNPEACRCLVEAGARSSGSPNEAVSGADYIVTMVKDDAASRSIWFGTQGAINGVKPGAIVIESSTVTPGWIGELADALQSRNVSLLDAPVSGSLPQAEKKLLVFLVGGDAAVLDRARAFLGAMGSKIHHVGSTGRGIVLKLAGNSLLGIQIAAIAEQLGYLAKSGIDINAAGEVLASLSSASPATINTAKLIAQRDFNPRFSIDLLVKDFAYARIDAALVGASVPLAEAAHDVFKHAADLGSGELNTSAVAKLYIS